MSLPTARKIAALVNIIVVVRALDGVVFSGHTAHGGAALDAAPLLPYQHAAAASVRLSFAVDQQFGGNCGNGCQTGNVGESHNHDFCFNSLAVEMSEFNRVLKSFFIFSREITYC